MEFRGYSNDIDTVRKSRFFRCATSSVDHFYGSVNYRRFLFNTNPILILKEK